MSEDRVNQEPITNQDISRQTRILRGQIKKAPRNHGKGLKKIAEEKLRNERALNMTRNALKVAEEESVRDSLTGLFNLKYFEEYLPTALATARRHEKDASVLFIDLDRFKEVNDREGHAAGDDVLREVARIFQKVLRTEDVPARKGGDEFVVFLPQASADDALNVARRITEAAQETLPFGATTSIGVANYQKDMSPKELIKKADIAMYASKSAGGDTATIYTEGMKNSNSTTREK